MAQTTSVTRREFVRAAAAGFSAATCGCAKCVPGPTIGTPVQGPTIVPPPICQVAFSVLDLQRTRGWYQRVFGFLPSGSTSLFGNPIGSWIQGLPDVETTTGWMMDQQDFLQLEMFEYRHPKPRPRPPTWRPNDTGYTTVGLHVADLDGTLERLRRVGAAPLTEPIGQAGSRRVCVHDPEGVLLELMEDDPRESGATRARPRPEVPVATRSVTLSVPDLERSRRFFVETLKLEEAVGVELHQPEHEALWGLPGASSEKLLLWAGDFLIQLKQYTDPTGSPWPKGYRISDQGLLNVAFGFREKERFQETYERVIASGYSSNSAPFGLFDWAVVYVNDDQCFSVELLLVEPSAERRLGFQPAADAL